MNGIRLFFGADRVWVKLYYTKNLSCAISIFCGVRISFRSKAPLMPRRRSTKTLKLKLKLEDLRRWTRIVSELHSTTSTPFSCYQYCMIEIVSYKLLSNFTTYEICCVCGTNYSV